MNEVGKEEIDRECEHCGENLYEHCAGVMCDNFNCPGKRQNCSECGETYDDIEKEICRSEDCPSNDLSLEKLKRRKR